MEKQESKKKTLKQTNKRMKRQSGERNEDPYIYAMAYCGYIYKQLMYTLIKRL